MSDEKEEIQSQNDKVSLMATAESTDAGIMIRYEVRNMSDHPLLLWDRMIGYNDNGQYIDPGAAYVFFEEPRTIRIVAAPLPLPESRDIGRKEIPYAREIPPNSSLSGEIRLPSPISEFSPYFEPPGEENQETKECEELRLLVGWTEKRTGMNISERIVGGEKVLAIRGAWEKPYQLVAERIIPLKTSLVTYTSEFERQMPLQ